MDGPWQGILSSKTFAIFTAYHITKQDLPDQLVLGCDIILLMIHIDNLKKSKQYTDINR